MSDVENLLAQHRTLRAAMPHAWNAFFARFGSLRPIQLAAMPLILAGRSTLVMAPTAGGKTEAISAPICERLAQHRWPGLSVLLITPTRALVNDLFARLESPLSTMQIRLGRKTGDHPSWKGSALQFLVTTPESTESMLTFHRDELADVKAVIIDEVHLLDGTPRGDHLRLVLQRLSRFLQAHGRDYVGLQRIAMSATVSDPQRVASTFLGPEAVVVSVPGQRAIESNVITAVGDERARISTAVAALDGLSDVRKVLVFVNSRTLVDAATAHFQAGRFRNVPVYGHHGSLSKHTREHVETRFKQDECAICVATMTLEIGIDIGDIDLVLCLDPPFSLSSFLQRIGRGCRRLQGLTRVLCVARDRGNELIFRALLRQAQIGVPRGPAIPFRRSVLVQQILAYIRQVDRHRRTAEQIINALGAADASPLSGEAITRLLSELVAVGLLDHKSGVFQPAADGWEFIQSNKIYSNIAATPLETAVVDADTGKTIASVATIATEHGGVRIAGRSYEVLSGSTANRKLVRSAGDFVASPRYHSHSLPYSFDIGVALAELLAVAPGTILCLRIGDGVAVFTWLGKLLNLAVAHGLEKTGIAAAAEPFHLRTNLANVGAVIGSLRTAVTQVKCKNPLGQLNISRIVDLGPYFDLLSPEAQSLARCDWLDGQFLDEWAAKLTCAEEVSHESQLGRDLLSLA